MRPDRVRETRPPESTRQKHVPETSPRNVSHRMYTFGELRGGPQRRVTTRVTRASRPSAVFTVSVMRCSPSSRAARSRFRKRRAMRAFTAAGRDSARSPSPGLAPATRQPVSARESRGPSSSFRRRERGTVVRLSNRRGRARRRNPVMATPYWSRGHAEATRPHAGPGGSHSRQQSVLHRSQHARQRRRPGTAGRSPRRHARRSAAT